MSLTACASEREGLQGRLERAQREVFEAPYSDVFSAVVEVLSRDYTLTVVEPDTGSIETAPKPDVVLNTGEFQGVYNIKIRAVVAPLVADRTEVLMRVMAGRLIDFAENRWAYKDFGSPQYYEEYFRIIQTTVRERRGAAKSEQ